MGAGTAVSLWSLIGGIFLIVIGGIFCLTIIGAIIGVPMIIVGLGLIGGGAIAGGTVGAGNIAYRGYKESKKEQREDLKLKADLHSKGLCPKCGAKVSSKDNFCKSCGNAFSNYDKESEWECEHCKEEFILGKKEQKELEKKGKIKIKCPYCKKQIVCEN